MSHHILVVTCYATIENEYSNFEGKKTTNHENYNSFHNMQPPLLYPSFLSLFQWLSRTFFCSLCRPLWMSCLSDGIQTTHCLQEMSTSIHKQLIKYQHFFKFLPLFQSALNSGLQVVSVTIIHSTYLSPVYVFVCSFPIRHS